LSIYRWRLDDQRGRHHKDHSLLFLWGAAAVNVNTSLPPNSGWVLNTATGIDDNGRISGNAAKTGETESCYLLTPE
jgi:hypothetical protein